VTTEEKILIKVGSTTNKVQKTFKIGNRYRKEWTKGYRTRHIGWLRYHTRWLNEVKPGYLLSSHHVNNELMWCEYKEIPGIDVKKLLRDKKFTRNLNMTDFVAMYRKFCLKNINDTRPYAHMDWQVDNILINGDWKDINNWDMVDWDNLGYYPPREVLEKMEQDIEESFAKEEYEKVRQFKSWDEIRKNIKESHKLKLINEMSDDEDKIKKVKEKFKLK
tara:strand:+ start:200 stop:856 length:657 start_codon:yes stop_codon:yes gene_type:complete